MVISSDWFVENYHEKFYGVAPIWKKVSGKEIEDFINKYPRDLIMLEDFFQYPSMFYYYDTALNPVVDIPSMVAMGLGYEEERYSGEIITNYNVLYETRTGYLDRPLEEIEKQKKWFYDMQPIWRSNREQDIANIEAASFIKVWKIKKQKDGTSIIENFLVNPDEYHS